MKAFVLIKIRAGDISSVIGHLKRVDGCLSANMTFGPYDAVAVMTAEDVNHLGTILAKQVQPIPGVMDTITCMAVDEE
jgi:DNA-binding Lrp family transcriptional regulator